MFMCANYLNNPVDRHVIVHVIYSVLQQTRYVRMCMCAYDILISHECMHMYLIFLALKCLELNGPSVEINLP